MPSGPPLAKMLWGWWVEKTESEKVSWDMCFSDFAKFAKHIYMEDRVRRLSNGCSTARADRHGCQRSGGVSGAAAQSGAATEQHGSSARDGSSAARDGSKADSSVQV